MDFNDLNLRLKRVYNAINKQYDYKVEDHIRFEYKKTDKFIEYTMKPGNYNDDETELNNRVFGVISVIAGLKDHLKTKFGETGNDPQEVENMINNSDELKLILDLWNQDKHGYPLKKHRRSNKNPKIKNIKQVFEMKSDPGSFSNAYMIFKPNIRKIEYGKNVRVAITGEVVDEQNNFIISLEKMIEKSMDNIEKLIQDNNIQASII